MGFQTIEATKEQVEALAALESRPLTADELRPRGEPLRRVDFDEIDLARRTMPRSIFRQFYPGLGPVQKKQGYGRILRTFVRNGREYSYHATKGWRVRRA